MFNKHRVAFTDPGSTMKPEEVAKKILDDSNAPKYITTEDPYHYGSPARVRSVSPR
jgi:hypothetical protein